MPNMLSVNAYSPNPLVCPAVGGLNRYVQSSRAGVKKVVYFPLCSYHRSIRHSFNVPLLMMVHVPKVILVTESECI